MGAYELGLACIWVGLAIFLGALLFRFFGGAWKIENEATSPGTALKGFAVLGGFMVFSGLGFLFLGLA